MHEPLIVLRRKPRTLLDCLFTLQSTIRVGFLISSVTGTFSCTGGAGALKGSGALNGSAGALNGLKAGLPGSGTLKASVSGALNGLAGALKALSSSAGVSELPYSDSSPVP